MAGLPIYEEMALRAIDDPEFRKKAKRAFNAKRKQDPELVKRKQFEMAEAFRAGAHLKVARYDDPEFVENDEEVDAYTTVHGSKPEALRVAMATRNPETAYPAHALTVERRRKQLDGDNYSPPSRNDWGGMMTHEWTWLCEALIKDGLIPEPTVNVEHVLSRPLLTLNRLIFRWRLTPFRFTPQSCITQLLNRIRPGMGYVVVIHDVREHERGEHTRTYRAKDGTIKTTTVRASRVSAHTRGA